MMSWNKQTFFNNLGMQGGEQAFDAMVGRMQHAYSRDQIQEQLWRENRGRNNVDSPAGAMGFPQMMPDTIKGLQKNYPNRGYSNARDPAQGMMMYEDLMMENYRRAKKKGLSDADASRLGVRAYHGGWNEDDWGKENRAYDLAVNRGLGNTTFDTVQAGGQPTAGSGSIPQEQAGRFPGNVDMIAAYNKGLQQRKAQAQYDSFNVNQNFMMPFQNLKMSQGSEFQKAFQQYADFRG